MNTRTRAKQNLLVASVNAALERSLITLECEPVARTIFEFNIGTYPVIAFVADGGFSAVAVHAIAKPTELGRRMVGHASNVVFSEGQRFGEATAFAWLERRRGKYLQPNVNYLGTEAATEYLGALAITPLGFGTNRKEYTRMFGRGRQ